MIKSRTKETYKTEIENGTNTLIADEPLSNGGTNLGLTPMELLQASLASCTTITLRMYADRSEWIIAQIEATVNKTEGLEPGVFELDKHIHITGDVDQKQLDRLLYIASKCPVHKVLAKNTVIHSRIVKV